MDILIVVALLFAVIATIALAIGIAGLVKGNPDMVFWGGVIGLVAATATKIIEIIAKIAYYQ
jgi:hypothetical protein